MVTTMPNLSANSTSTPKTVANGANSDDLQSKAP